MKKIILALSAVALIVSCSQTRQWTDKEREAVRKELRDHRDRSAIRHMEAANYTNLENCVLETVEQTYPDYNQYDKLTGKTDTLIGFFTDCTEYTIGKDFENLPLLFPYAQLVENSILPAGLTTDQQNAFYDCLKESVKELYRTPGQFTVALFDEPGVPTELADAMQRCAAQVTGQTAKADSVAKK